MTVKTKCNYYCRGRGLYKKIPASVSVLLRRDDFAGGIIPTKFFWNFAGPREKNTGIRRCFFNLYQRVYVTMHNGGKIPYRVPPDIPLILCRAEYS